MISAAFAVPVVPEVYWSSAVSSSVRGTWEIGRDFKISRKASVSGQGAAGSRNDARGGSVGWAGRKSRYEVTATASSFVCAPRIW